MELEKDKNKNKKQHRSTGEKSSTNKRCNLIPDLLQVSGTVTDTVKVDCDEITSKMSDIQVTAASAIKKWKNGYLRRLLQIRIKKYLIWRKG